MLLWRIYAASNSKNIRRSCKVSDIFVRFQTHLDFLDRFSFKSISNFIEISPASSALIHADGEVNGRTDMTKLTSDILEYAKASTVSNSYI